MRLPTSIIIIIIIGFIVGTDVRAATNDLPSAVLTLPKSDSTSRMDSILIPGIGQTNTPGIALHVKGTNIYTMQILKPNPDAKFCLQIAKPAEGTNYVIAEKGTNYGIVFQTNR